MNILLIIFLLLNLALTFLILVMVVRNVAKFSKHKKEGPLAARLKRSLKFLEKEGNITLEEYEDYLGISREKSLEDLEYLEKLGFLDEVEIEGGSFYRFIGRKV